MTLLMIAINVMYARDVCSYCEKVVVALELLGVSGEDVGSSSAGGPLFVIVEGLGIAKVRLLLHTCMFR